MAVIKTKLTSLPRTRRVLLTKMLLGPALGYLVDLVAGLSQVNIRLRIPLQLVVALALYLWMRRQAVQYNILSAGIAAERAAAKLLTRLPDTIAIYSDIALKAGRETAQIDHLVITPAGVFVLEAKSWRGVLRGDGDHSDWTLLKSGKGGGRYQKSVPSPYGQLDRQIRVVGRLAARVGRNVAVWGVLFLPYQEAQVEVRNQRHQIVVGEQVLRMLRTQPAKLSRTEVDRLISLVDSEL